MSMLLKLLKDGKFHSGEALGAALGISRSAVWKQLQQLQAELGLSIHKVRGRGYQLSAPLEPLSGAAIEAAAQPGCWPVIVLESVDSTNAQALRMLGQGTPAPFLVMAERQTAGRGRRGRTWVSPYGENLYYSLVLRIDGGLRQIEGMSLVVGLAVMHTLRELGTASAGLKWPNDILADQRKLAGILLELVGDPADVCHVVIGIGINVNMQAAEEVDQLWTSMRLQSGTAVDRNALAALLCAKLSTYLERHRQDGFAAIQEEWEQNHLWQGKQVSLIAGVNQIEGVVLGIDQQGALRLKVDGQERVYSGGEMSLRLRHDS